MKQIISIIILIGLCHQTYCVNFEDCGTRDASVSSISVSGCSSSDTACVLKSGSNQTIDVQFKPSVDSATNTIKVTGILNGLEVPWAVNPSDACKWGLNCPVKSGSNQELKLTLPISTIYPKIALTARLAVVDASGGNLFCKQFAAHIA